ncbi:MAG: hypothetical protein WBA12_08150, partial [Catalinimonas sp.]
ELWLYGPFDADRYKVMELKEPTEQRFYLYYQGTYYHLSPTKKVAPLRPKAVTRAALIERLDVLR